MVRQPKKQHFNTIGNRHQGNRQPAPEIVRERVVGKAHFQTAGHSLELGQDLFLLPFDGGGP